MKVQENEFRPNGTHLVAGEWVEAEATFASDPAHGPAHEFSIGTPALVGRGCEAAEDAFWSYGYSPAPSARPS